MVNNPILARFPGISHLVQSKRPTLQDAFRNPGKLPDFVSNCPSAMRILDLLGPLSWADFPERNLHRNWGRSAIPYAAFSAACLLKLNEHLVSMGDLRQYLVEHPLSYGCWDSRWFHPCDTPAVLTQMSACQLSVT